MPIDVHIRERPADTTFQHHRLDDELTLAQVVEKTLPRPLWTLCQPDLCERSLQASVADLPEERQAHAAQLFDEVRSENPVPLFVATVNEVEIAMTDWESVMVEDGDSVLIAAVPAGLIDDLFKTALIVAAVAFTASYAVALFVPAVAGSLSALQFALVSAAIAGISTLLMGFLAPKQDAFSVPSPAYRIQGIGNRPRWWQAVQVIYGEHRIFPPIAARSYHEAVAEKSIVRFLMDCGPGHMEIAQVKIGQEDIHKYKKAEFKTHINTDTSSLEYYTNQRRTTDHNVRLSNEEWSEFTTHPGTTEAYVHVLFPSGLFSGGHHASMEIVYRWKRVADANYQTAADALAAINVSGLAYSGFGRSQRVYYSTPTLTRRVRPDSTSSDFQAADIEGIATEESRLQNRIRDDLVYLGARDWTMLNAANEGWEAQDNTANGVLYIAWHQRTLAIGFNAATNLSGKALYLELGKRQERLDFPSSAFAHVTWTLTRIMPAETFRTRAIIADAGLSFDAVFAVEQDPEKFSSFYKQGEKEIRKRVRGPFEEAVHISFPEAGTYDIRVKRKRVEHALTSITVADRADVIRIQSVRPDNPTNVENHSWIEGKVQASEQLSGVLDSLNMVVKRHIPVWNGTQWVTQFSSSPAWIAVDILRTGPKAVPDAQLDLPTWILFATHCASKGYEWHGIIDAQATKRDQAALILEVAHAEIIRPSGKYSVMWNRPDEPVAQVFSPRNMTSFQKSIQFPDDLHGIRTQYMDPARDWTLQEVSSYASGYTEENAELFETREPIGVRSRTQAYRYGNFALAERQQRPVMYMLGAVLDHLVCTRGSRIRVQGFHVGTRWCSGRIASLEHDSGRVAYLYSDTPPIDGIEDQGVGTIRIVNSGGIRVSLATWDEDREAWGISQTVNTISEGLIEDGDHFTVGATGTDTIELRVREIEYDANMQASISCTDWNVAEISTGEATGNTPSYDAKSAQTSKFYSTTELDAPAITELYGDHRAVKDGDPGIRIQFDPDIVREMGLPSLILHVSVYCATTNTTTEAQFSALQTNVRIGGLDAENWHTVTAWYAVGDRTSPSAEASVLVVGHAGQLPLITLDISVAAETFLRQFVWTATGVGADDVAGVLVQYARGLDITEDSEFGDVYGGVLTEKKYVTATPPEGDYTFRVAPVNSAGALGFWAYGNITFESTPGQDTGARYFTATIPHYVWDDYWIRDLTGQEPHQGDIVSLTGNHTGLVDGHLVQRGDKASAPYQIQISGNPTNWDTIPQADVYVELLGIVPAWTRMDNSNYAAYHTQISQIRSAAPELAPSKLMIRRNDENYAVYPITWGADTGAIRGELPYGSTVSSKTARGRIGTATNYGTNEIDPQCVAEYNGETYVIGKTTFTDSQHKFLGILDLTTGVATPLIHEINLGTGTYKWLGAVTIGNHLHMLVRKTAGTITDDNRHRLYQFNYLTFELTELDISNALRTGYQLNGLARYGTDKLITAEYKQGATDSRGLIIGTDNNNRTFVQPIASAQTDNIFNRIRIMGELNSLGPAYDDTIIAYQVQRSSAEHPNAPNWMLALLDAGSGNVLWTVLDIQDQSVKWASIPFPENSHNPTDVLSNSEHIYALDLSRQQTVRPIRSLRKFADNWMMVLNAEITLSAPDNQEGDPGITAIDADTSIPVQFGLVLHTDIDDIPRYAESREYRNGQWQDLTPRIDGDSIARGTIQGGHIDASGPLVDSQTQLGSNTTGLPQLANEVLGLISQANEQTAAGEIPTDFSVNGIEYMPDGGGTLVYRAFANAPVSVLLNARLVIHATRSGRTYNHASLVGNFQVLAGATLSTASVVKTINFALRTNGTSTADEEITLSLPLQTQNEKIERYGAAGNISQSWLDHKAYNADLVSTLALDLPLTLAQVPVETNVRVYVRYAITENNRPTPLVPGQTEPPREVSYRIHPSPTKGGDPNLPQGGDSIHSSVGQGIPNTGVWQMRENADSAWVLADVFRDYETNLITLKPIDEAISRAGWELRWSWISANDGQRYGATNTLVIQRGSVIAPPSAKPRVTYSHFWTPPFFGNPPGRRISATVSSAEGITSYQWQRLEVSTASSNYQGDNRYTWSNVGSPSTTIMPVTLVGRRHLNSASVRYRLTWTRNGIMEVPDEDNVYVVES